ncbi:hypothetical protein Bbelb_339740 [Branchiostoma belcheri]|nr:hypothetical protein Bbelb_339740 [Branchiostoma belcheri]
MPSAPGPLRVEQSLFSQPRLCGLTLGRGWQHRGVGLYYVASGRTELEGLVTDHEKMVRQQGEAKLVQEIENISDQSSDKVRTKSDTDNIRELVRPIHLSHQSPGLYLPDMPRGVSAGTGWLVFAEPVPFPGYSRRSLGNPPTALGTCQLRGNLSPRHRTCPKSCVMSRGGGTA